MKQDLRVQSHDSRRIYNVFPKEKILNIVLTRGEHKLDERNKS